MNKKIGADPDRAFGLQEDVLERLRSAVKKNDGTIIVQMERFLKLSSRKRNQILGIQSPKILEDTQHLRFEGEVEVEALIESFDPDNHFCNNQSIKYYLGDSFQKYILKPVKSFSGLTAMSFSKHTLKETSYDKDHIMSELDITPESGKLMSREEILWTIAYLTGKQPKGEPGALKNDGNWTIIGYTMCDDGVLRVVGVRWGGDDWDCFCYGLGSWSAGRGVLSPNDI